MPSSILVSMRLRRSAIAACGALLIASAPAAAQSDGVVVDRDSPTSKEYALPLDQARRQADPSGGAASPDSSSGSGPSALFGAGVGDDDDPKGGSPAGRTKRAREKRGARAGRKDSAPVTEEAVRALGQAASRPGAPGGSNALLFLGGAAVLLAAGAGAGFVLRRRNPAT